LEDASLKKHLRFALPGAILAAAALCAPAPAYSQAAGPNLTSTTVLQAYVAPSLDRYLNHLSECLPETDLWVVRSSGSVCRPREAVDRAVGCLLSGPAAGLQGAWQIAQAAGITRIMTVDVGGTSTDVALCDGSLPFLEESSLAGLPFRCPQADIQTVGAGGGSIASLDAGGLLQVGPRSAGSQPGPACYGQGGPATVTDALLLLGRLPDQLAGGRLRLDCGASERMVGALAHSLRLPLEEVAAAIVALAEHNMAQALRLISLERGYDPRLFVLMAYGGGGASHATALAEQLGMRHILVPPAAEALAARAAARRPGADFAEVARRRSTGPGSREGGDLGYFKREDMIPEFAEAAFALAAGQVSAAPVRTQFGWHVIRVEDRRAVPPQSFEEVRDQLREQAFTAAVNAEVDRIRALARIERFNLDGSPVAPPSLLDGAAPPAAPRR
jgi:N-methylhydantoinase A